MKAYKLLTQEMTSHSGMKWEVGKTNTAEGEGQSMCSPDLLHCYSHPSLAVLFNPIHADIDNPRLFEIETSEILANDGLKMGCKSQTLVKELELPVFTVEQRVTFAIHCALEVCSDLKFKTWAEKWLSGEDRTASAVHAAFASASAYAAARAARAAYAAADAAAYAADAAAYAAARADAACTYAAARAARAANPKIGFLAILEKL